MANHPNCSRAKSQASNPHPDEIIGMRINAGLTQQQAAALVHSKLKSWQNWEAEPGSPSHRRMDPAKWELFLLKTGQADLVLDPRFLKAVKNNRS